MKTWKCLGLGALAPVGWLGAVFALAQPISAQTPPQTVYNVNALADGHDTHPGDGICDTLINNPGPARFCSLRAAIEENEAGGGGLIRIPASDPIVLNKGPITVTKNLQIVGAGAYSVSVDAGQQRGFIIGGNATADFYVRMSDFTIRNARYVSDFGQSKGGALSIEAAKANVNLSRMVFSGNSTDWRGAAINNEAYLEIFDCLIADNFLPKRKGIGVTGSGAGIYNDISGILTISGTVFTGNIATRGAAVFTTGIMNMTNCTLHGNKVNLRGGAIFNEASPKDRAVISYSTITNNETGIDPDPGEASPSQNINGGGIYNNGLLSMATTILAGNIDPRNTFAQDDGPDCYSHTDDRVSVEPTFTSYRDNIIGRLDLTACHMVDQSAGSPPRFDYYNTDGSLLDPLLYDLAQNGGLGMTREPKPGSPALTHAVTGPGTVLPCPSYDGRGAPRPDLSVQPNGGCTLGAYQSGAPNTLSIEAENALPTGAFAVAFDAAASNSRYVSAPTTAASQTAALNDAHKMTFRFYVDQPGSFKFRGTVKTPTGENNSFYVRVNGYPDAGYIWDLPVSNTAYVTDMIGSRGAGTEANPEVPEMVFNLSRGVNTVEVYLRETGAQLDKIELVPSGAFYQQEMETSAITGAFMVGFDPVASAGKFVYAPTGVNFMTAPNPANSMKIVLNAPTAGIYLLKGNVQAKRDTHNSFWVKVDGLPSSAYLWDMTEENAYFGADYLSDRGTGNSANPQVDAVELNLTAGPHTIEVFAREEGTRLDKLGLELKATAEARIISRNKTYTSSSNESSSYPPAKAFDNNLTTRWSSQFSDNQWIKADLGALYDIDRVVLNWEAAYATEYEIQISNDNENWTSLFHKTGNTGGIDNIMVTGRGRYVRMYGIHRATTAGFSLLEFNIYGSAASGGTVNLALSHGGATSGNQDPTFTGDKAVDGNLTTRWSSAYNDDQWFYVDLGTKQQLSGVKLRWEAAYGKGYEIQLSEDAVTWTPVFSTAAGNGGLDDLSIAGRARYVKMRGIKRATTAGYSLYEFEVYGR